VAFRPAVKVLVTSSRLPHALGVIRKLGEAGHEVFAADTFHTSPGSHSKWVREALIVPSPKFETAQFVVRLEEIVRTLSIDLVVPCFEEVFYLAKHLPDLSPALPIFCSPLETLVRLHDKQAFTRLTQDLGLPIAPTRVATSDAELAAATAEFPEYFARPSFSRGGVTLLTNTGPLAGAVRIEDCHPTPAEPWLVQEFVHGSDVCSFSVAQHGRLVAHCTYEHPLTIEHAGGIVFVSVDEPESVAIAERYVAELGYHGHISFDYLRTDRGLVMVECNPRPTAGVFMMAAGDLCDAIFSPSANGPTVVPAGVREQIGVAILRDMFRNPRDIPDDLHALLSGVEDVYSQRGDRLPGLYQFLSYSHVLAFRHRLHVKKHQHSDIMEAQFFDVSWDGGPLP
jgi:predicted ATP-grasp superfamily ATP-dependent carboligase